MPIISTANASDQCQFFFLVHIFVDSFETYDTSILQRRPEKHKGEKNTNFRGLKIKSDHFL